MDIKEHTFKANKDICQRVLAEFLGKFLNPAFGALPSKEINLMVMNILGELEYIESEPSLYELVTKLRVTRAKARNLIYDQELRRLDTETLDLRVKEALKEPLFQKQGDLFVLEIESPLIIDHLRSKLKSLGHATDGSFSPSLVKMSVEAVAALIEDYLPKESRKKVQNALIKAGAPDTSLQGVLKSTIKAIAKKVAQDSGEALVDKTSDFISPIVDSSIDKITKIAEDIFNNGK